MKQLLKLDEVYGVESSNISQLGYQDGDAYVVFTNGNVYKYPNVQRDMFESVLNAKSVGKAFSATLRKTESYEKLDVVVVSNENGDIDESERIEVTVKYKGKEVKVNRDFTKALLLATKDMTEIQVKEAGNGAMKAMRDVLKLQENQ